MQLAGVDIAAHQVEITAQQRMFNKFLKSTLFTEKINVDRVSQVCNNNMILCMFCCMVD